MLQQTQVTVVIPYFEKWMKRYPTLEALAKAELNDLIKDWEGLGYYTRVKNLQKGAHYILKEFGGKFPKDTESLQKIPGLGPYTVGAIQAFAFKQKAAAVDGNVFRVLSRYFAIQEEITKVTTQKKIRKLAQNLLPDQAPWEVAEALIELGAILCKKKPLCESCPLKEGCQAFNLDLQEKLPHKRNPISTKELFRMVPILFHEKEVLIRQVPEGEVMGGLHEFPFFETSQESFLTTDLREKLQSGWGITPLLLQKLPTIKHSFTRYTAHLKPAIFRCSAKHTPQGYFWVSLNELEKYSFSSGHRRILAHLKFAS